MKVNKVNTEEQKLLVEIQKAKDNITKVNLDIFNSKKACPSSKMDLENG